MEFTLRRQEVIVPSPPSSPHVVTLTSIDHNMPPVYTRFLYFFPSLTRLGCGRVVMTILLHHIVAGGTAQAHFVASWAALAREEPIIAHPHLDRTCMQAQSLPLPSFDHHEYFVHKIVPSVAFSINAVVPTVMFWNFEFLPQDIQVLKEQTRVGGESCTRFQALSAHIWKHVAKGVDALQQSKLVWTVDGHKQFNLHLLANYFGNVTFFGCIEEKLGDMIAQPVHCIAMRIQSANQCITDEYQRSAMDLIAVQGLLALIHPITPNHLDLLITSWVHFKAYDVDFGWGLPVFFAPSTPIFLAGVVVLLSHVHSHGVNVLIGLFQPHMDALLLDVHFHQIQ